jgi:hypothetical protein
MTSVLVYKSFVLQADAAFAAKEYFIAASFYAKVILILLFVSHDNVYCYLCCIVPIETKYHSSWL